MKVFLLSWKLIYFHELVLYFHMEVIYFHVATTILSCNKLTNVNAFMEVNVLLP